MPCLRLPQCSHCGFPPTLCGSLGEHYTFTPATTPSVSTGSELTSARAAQQALPLSGVSTAYLSTTRREFCGEP